MDENKIPELIKLSAEIKVELDKLERTIRVHLNSLERRGSGRHYSAADRKHVSEASKKWWRRF